jgi:hypothetical protein
MRDTKVQIGKCRMKFSTTLLMLVLLDPAFAQDSNSQAVKHFDYDAHAPLDN